MTIIKEVGGTSSCDSQPTQGIISEFLWVYGYLCLNLIVEDARKMIPWFWHLKDTSFFDVEKLTVPAIAALQSLASFTDRIHFSTFHLAVQGYAQMNTECIYYDD